MIMRGCGGIEVNWRDSVLYSECSWHQLSPYIGRMKSSMAQSLVAQFTEPGDTVYDPFCGAGTVALEAWLGGRHVIAGDLNPYAYVLTKGKMTPPPRLEDALSRLVECWREATVETRTIDLRRVPVWIRRFFHPDTLRETLAIRNVLCRRRQWFLLSCLLGILHHWRPAFLSYPSSHTVPYLMDKRYPRDVYPEMYSYKEVYPRLLAKIERAFVRSPVVDRGFQRSVTLADALAPPSVVKSHRISAIITSPPYMNSLSYARDNRMRLWFLGVHDYKSLEPVVSPRKPRFLAMMQSLLRHWAALLNRGGVCALVLGAVRRDGKYHNLPEEISQLTRTLSCGLRITAICKNLIPDRRRARGNCRSTREDTILVLRRR